MSFTFLGEEVWSCRRYCCGGGTTARGGSLCKFPSCFPDP